MNPTQQFILRAATEQPGWNHAHTVIITRAIQAYPQQPEKALIHTIRQGRRLHSQATGSHYKTQAREIQTLVKGAINALRHLQILN